MKAAALQVGEVYWVGPSNGPNAYYGRDARLISTEQFVEHPGSWYLPKNTPSYTVEFQGRTYSLPKWFRPKQPHDPAGRIRVPMLRVRDGAVELVPLGQIRSTYADYRVAKSEKDKVEAAELAAAGSLRNARICRFKAAREQLPESLRAAGLNDHGEGTVTLALDVYVQLAARLSEQHSLLSQIEAYCDAYVESETDADAMNPEPWNPAAYVLSIVAPDALAELLADA